MFYSSQADELRAFIGDKLGLSGTDVGGGWLIFDAPEADLACTRPRAAALHRGLPMSRSTATTSRRLCESFERAASSSRKKPKTKASAG